MIIPRDYQLYAAESVIHYFGKKYGNPVVGMPTGTGKSVTIAALVWMMMQYPGTRVVIATHVKELIQQNFDKLMELWPQAPAGIYSSGLKRKDLFLPITFVGVASVKNRAEQFGHVDVLLIDECHMLNPDEETSYMKFIKGLKQKNPLLKVVGFSATLYRMGQGRLTEEGGLFTDVCVDMTTMECFNWFIDEGYILPLVPKKTTFELDVSKVKKTAGDFNGAALQEAVDKSEITYKALTEAVHYGQDRECWIVFAAGVEHAIHCAEMLNSMGISCGVVHSKMSDGERDRQIADWKAGKVRCISNNGVLTTGVDNPRLDFIIMLRPTMSVVLWVQMLGRGTRPVYAPGFDLFSKEGRLASILTSSKHNTLVLDFAKNTRRLGPVNDPREPRKKGDGGGEAPTKLCPCCDTWNHASARVCINEDCKDPTNPHTFTFSVKYQETAAEDELIKKGMPETKVYEVDSITYMPHIKHGTGSRSLKVTYHSGVNSFAEWVPVEGLGSAQGIAKRWWKARTAALMPTDLDDVLLVVNDLPAATHIRVWTNCKPYPQILAHCFDGTSFGEKEDNSKRPYIASKQSERKDVQTRFDALSKGPQSVKVFDDMDDDIPF